MRAVHVIASADAAVFLVVSAHALLDDERGQLLGIAAFVKF